MANFLSIKSNRFGKLIGHQSGKLSKYQVVKKFIDIYTVSFLVGLMIQKFANACGFFEHYPKSIHESAIYFLAGAAIAVNQVVFLMLIVKCINLVELKVNVSKKNLKYFICSFIPATVIMFIQGVR